MRCVFVDMPMGLAEGGTRLADMEARQFLPSHLKSSIFNTPVRDAVHARVKSVAKSINRKLTGKSLSEQSLGLCSKIREVDACLQADELIRQLLYEAHPEICFIKCGAKPPAYTKKDLLGGIERIRVLERFVPDVEGILKAVRAEYPVSRVAADDVLDALVLAVSAWGSQGRPQFFPVAMQTPPKDGTGLDMAVWFHDFAL